MLETDITYLFYGHKRSKAYLSVVKEDVYKRQFYETLANNFLKDKKEIVLNSILTDSQINQLLN